jgi:hypothetical protein
MVSCASGGELVQVSSPRLEPITYRNFNVCPHCILHGKQSLLCRLCEGIPMISRSDGKTFHLLLADHPAQYPAERTPAIQKRLRCVSGIRTYWIPGRLAQRW